MNRDELIQLSDEGKIKYKKKFLKEADDATIEKISKEYVAKQLDATNERVADIIIEKFSDLLAQTEMVENECDLKKELSKNKMLRNDLKSFVGSVTPYVPYIGLISGLLTVGGYVVYKKFKTEGTEGTRSDTAEPPEEDFEEREVTAGTRSDTAHAKPQPEEDEAFEIHAKQPPKKPNEVRQPKERKPRAPRKPRKPKAPNEDEAF